MTVIGAFGDGKEVNAQLLRLAMMAILDSSGSGLTCDGGVRMNRYSLDALQVVAGPAGLTGIVKPGFCIVPGTESTAQGAYPVINDANKTITLNPADGAQSRYDRIVAMVDDNGDSTTSYDIVKVTGTPAGSPALPTIPANSLKLGAILVPPNATTPGQLTYIDERKALGAYGRPYVSLPFTAGTVFQPEHNTTSATFGAVEMNRTMVQYSGISMDVLTRSTASDTTGEIRVTVNGVQWSATRTVVANNYQTRLFQAEVFPGFGSSIKLGDTVEIYVEARRTGGTGTIGARVLNAVQLPV